MLGAVLVRHLAHTGTCDVSFTSRRPGEGLFYDVREGYDPLRSLLAASGPFDYVVNCIAVLAAAIDATSSGSLQSAVLANAVLPHWLAVAAMSAGTRVIHVSTDGVFSGLSAEPYDEASQPDATDAYGRTKALGEPYGDGVSVLRCSIIGTDARSHRGLIEWLLARPKGSSVPGFVDQYWNGVTTLELARVIATIVSSGSDASQPPRPLHVCAREPVSKYDLLRFAADAFSKRVTVEPVVSRARGTSRRLTTRYPSYSAAAVTPGGLPAALQALRALANDPPN